MPQLLLMPAQADCHSQGTFPQLAGGRNGLGEATNGPKWSGSWGRQTCPPLFPSSREQLLSSCRTSVSASRRSSWDAATAAQFHGSYTTTRYRGWGGLPGAWSREGLLLPLPFTALLLSHAGHPNMGGSMQRMNPPRGMGPMGPGPQVTSRLSGHPSPWPSVCPRLLSSFHSLSVFPHCLACRGERKGRDLVPSCSLPRAGPTPHTARSRSLSRQS